MAVEFNVCVGVVLYKPQIERLKQSLEVLISITELVILVDNGSCNIQAIEQLIDGKDNILLLKNSDNLGIATALNQICSYASEHNYDWVLTMDQDTICPVDIIQKLYRFAVIERVGILCPVVDYEGLKISSKLSDGEITETYACMTSGSLTNIKAWREIGGFREDYFIDYVDNEFCKKLLLNHYRILRVNNCVMHHQLGNAKKKRVLGLFKKKVCIHSPLRYYYMTRNNLFFIWEYKETLNVFKEYLKLCSIIWGGLLWADNRTSTLIFIVRGIKDAHNRVKGKYRG
jgi:rhamnosyltransferase